MYGKDVLGGTPAWWNIGFLGKALATGSTLLNSLVSYWPLNEQSGTRVDVVGDNDLTDNNTVGAVNRGPVGTVASFVTANSEYLEAAATGTYDQADHSVAGWAMVPIGTADGGYAMVGNGGRMSILAIVSGGVVTSVRYGMYDGANYQLAYTASSIPLGSWFHFVATGAVDLITIWANNSDTATDIPGGYAVPDTNVKFKIGDYNGSSFFTGRIRNVSIHSRIISAPERASLFNSGNGKSYADLTAAEQVGLVSYWNLDEASDTRYDSHGANDLTDNNTVGSIVNTKAAVNGAAASFVAANSESLSVADNASLRVGVADFTVAFWYKRNANLGTLNFPVSKGTQEDWCFDDNPFSNKGMRFYTKNGGGYPTAAWGSALTLNEWYLVLGWRSSADQKVYIQINNGTPVEAATGAIVNEDTNKALNVGGFVTYYGTSSIDEVAIWSRVLTEDERTELYNAGAGQFYDWDVSIVDPSTDPAPAVPTNFSSSEEPIQSEAVYLSWDEVTGATGYYIYKDGVPQVDEGISGSDSNVWIGGLTPETTYSFQIASFNDSWQGAKSAAISVETPAS